MNAFKAIVTKYHGPGNVRGARYSATAEGGNRVSVQADDALNSDENHKAAARALCLKLHWGGHLVCGGIERGRVWVFTRTGKNKADNFTISE